MKEPNKKIFLVEDDSAIVEIYKTLMEKSHFDVEAFTLGQEVVKAIKNINNEGSGEKKPDMILLDLILPDMNGMDILREIKNNNATKDVKVFILTNQQDVDIDGLGAMKPDRVITKANFTPTQLVDLIKDELSNKQ